MARALECMDYIWAVNLCPTKVCHLLYSLLFYAGTQKQAEKSEGQLCKPSSLAAVIDLGCLWRKAEIISNYTPCWGKPLLCWVLLLQMCSDYLVSWLSSHMAKRDPGLQPKNDTSPRMHGLQLRGKSLPQQGVSFNISPSLLCKHPEAGWETRRKSVQTEFLCLQCLISDACDVRRR